jgi:hypothetical protein
MTGEKSPACTSAFLFPSQIAEPSPSAGLTAWSSWKGVGFRGDWGDARREKGASRSPCAALNACANMGVLDSSGRHLTPMELSAAICYTYSSSSFSRLFLLLSLMTFPVLLPSRPQTSPQLSPSNSSPPSSLSGATVAGSTSTTSQRTTLSNTTVLSPAKTFRLPGRRRRYRRRRGCRRRGCSICTSPKARRRR